MFDIALASAGTNVSLSTSCDPNFPPENMIDGSAETFWSSTGLYPQEFVLSFGSLMNVSNVQIKCYNVKTLSVERSVQGEPLDFEPLDEKDLDHTDGQIQTEDFNLSNTTAQHIRFTVHAGYDHFICVNKVSVEGSAVHG